MNIKEVSIDYTIDYGLLSSHATSFFTRATALLFILPSTVHIIYGKEEKIFHFINNPKN